MARRVGFGDRERETPRDRNGDGQDARESAGAPATEGGARRPGPAARLFIILFLLVWLALWTFGIVEAWDAASSLFDQPAWEPFDYAVLAFFAIWLTGALIGWAFGVVLLFVMLFGKEVERSPEEQAARWRRRLSRRRGKDAA